jgi:hypothetical protein
VHHGLFEAGRACGAGVLYEAVGAVMQGSWLDNRRVGAFRTIDPKGGLWDDAYDDEGKRTSRKKAAPPVAPPATAAAAAAAATAAAAAAAAAAVKRAALACRHCGVKFHAAHNYRCRQHSGTWVDASRYDASRQNHDHSGFPFTPDFFL